ncbi:hypothetical protein PMAYCL1PPCAC_18781 [Pristionchus mayeri]|uniref:Uncharacterized protein n=1 Tax=Pristionchus mayeri TaxID=1317129 RepID=A0AAN5I2E8_9BILA|nr:hypothetical protein PMAYCL1PPCAC_18781 [Pristionchus mayeri]
MSSPRPIRRSLDSTLSRLSQVSSSSPSSSQSTASPFSSDNYVRRRDSLDSVYSSSSSYCSYGTVTSPPTRWPTSRTPRRRRPLELANQSILESTVSSLDESSIADESTVSSRSMDCLNDSGFHDDIFRSPPVNKTALSQTSLLRTPTNDLMRQRSTNSAFLSTTNSPSPLRAFKVREVSHISSNVSRTGGSTMMRFSGADISCSQLVHLTKSDSSLQPSGHQRAFSPTPSTMRDIKIETPSKGYWDDDDSLFSMASSSMMRMRDIPEITSGPIESSLYPFVDSSSYFTPLDSSNSMDEEDETCDGLDEDSDEEDYNPSQASPPSRPSILQHSLPPPAPPPSSVRQPLADLQQNSLKRRADEGWKSGMEMKKGRSNLDRPVPQIYAEDVKPDLTQLISSLPLSSSSVKPKSSFRTPKKQFKTYSKRWWQVCTGSTQDMRSVTSQAHAFLRRYGLDSAPSMTSSSSSFSSSSMPVKEESFFDSDVHFAPYLTGIDTSYAAPEDPLNYQPPPLSLLY